MTCYSAWGGEKQPWRIPYDGLPSSDFREHPLHQQPFHRWGGETEHQRNYYLSVFKQAVLERNGIKKSREIRRRERGNKINCSICLVCQDRRASSMFGACFLPKVLSECSPVYAEQDTTLSNVGEPQALESERLGLESWLCHLPAGKPWQVTSLTFCLNLADTRLNGLLGGY